MTSYYLDCETYREDRDRPNPKLDKLTTINLQKIDSRGYPVGDLHILKSWEISEKKILSEFFKISGWLNNPNPWSFIPIGFNLNFDLWIIYNRTKEVLGQELKLDFLFYDLSKIDIKQIIVLFNNGKFKGASLDIFSNKTHSGAFAYELIKRKKWDKLVKYIENETLSFIELYQEIMGQLPSIKEQISENLELKK